LDGAFEHGAIGRAQPKAVRRQMPYCDTTVELDVVTLIWTRGENFPIDILKDRLRCPKCGRLDTVRVFFDVPNQPNAGVAAE
jgi:hypothetical protein